MYLASKRCCKGKRLNSIATVLSFSFSSPLRSSGLAHVAAEGGPQQMSTTLSPAPYPVTSPPQPSNATKAQCLLPHHQTASNHGSSVLQQAQGGRWPCPGRQGQWAIGLCKGAVPGLYYGTGAEKPLLVLGTRIVTLTFLIPFSWSPFTRHLFRPPHPDPG